MCVLPHFYRISSLGEMDVLEVKGAKLEIKPNVENNLPGDLCRWLCTRRLCASMSESKAHLVKR